MFTDWNFEHEYLDLLFHIMEKGEDRQDRTGTGTRAIFGATLNIDLGQGFPLLTTKRMPFKSVAAELLWFIEGSSDERRLAEILHGTRDPSKKTIWSPNAAGTTGASYQPEFDGDLGRIYGVQWRSWRKFTVAPEQGHESGATRFDESTVDQLCELVHKLKTNPTDRRMILSAWNPGELDQMALPPCHMFVQFYLSNDRKLSCQMYQRSVDSFLGLPFNIASYALLVHMLAYVINASVGTLTMVLGDTHIYNDHFDAVRTQLKREPGKLPTLVLKPVADIDSFKLSDFILAGYEPQDAISARMSA